MERVIQVLPPCCSQDKLFGHSYLRETAISLIESLYGLHVTTIKELNSYDDRNYFITVGSDYSNPQIPELWPHGYVFKVLNSMDSHKKHVGKYTIQVYIHLVKPCNFFYRKSTSTIICCPNNLDSVFVLSFHYCAEVLQS